MVSRKCSSFKQFLNFLYWRCTHIEIATVDSLRSLCNCCYQDAPFTRSSSLNVILPACFFRLAVICMLIMKQRFVLHSQQIAAAEVLDEPASSSGVDWSFPSSNKHRPTCVCEILVPEGVEESTFCCYRQCVVAFRSIQILWSCECFTSHSLPLYLLLLFPLVVWRAHGNFH